ncbi:MAG: hypothetical protein B7Y41_11525 [Hydrogenophilales bacterium 28-61-23]|nr:MAG: hypothetical protein B7Y41_11525 [Hydrogenophilales bacterium 28-61-23]
MMFHLPAFNALTMNDRVLLYLSAVGASYALYHRATLQEVHSLPSDEEGWESFNTLLLNHPGKPVAIAVDTVDEIYRQDILPRAHGADRLEMTERRQRQLIHHSAYRAALRQKPVASSSGKNLRQDRYLMMGLTNPEIIRPWLDILHVRGAHLAGIWLLPALAIPLAKQFRLTRNRLLLVSEQTGGLRLTYLEDGELRFSRLAPVDSSEYENPLESYAEEIERTRQSLVGQRLLARSEPLHTMLLDPLNTLEALRAFLPESAGFQCETIQRAQLLETLQLPPTLLAESSDALYLKLLPSAPQSANLMTREQHAVTRLHWMKRGLFFVAAAWLGLAVLISALLLLDAWRLDIAADKARAASLKFQTDEAGLLASVGGKNALERRLQTVQTWQSVAARDQFPAEGFQSVLNIGQQIDHLRFQRLAWMQSTPESPPLLTIEGEVLPFDNDYSAAHRDVRRLVEQLRRHFQNQTIRVKRWPLDTATNNELEGEFGHSHASARFQIEVGASEQAGRTP